MAALMTSMCLVTKQGQKLKYLTDFKQVYRIYRRDISTVRRVTNLKHFKVSRYCVCFYSTQPTGGNVKGLTDEILKSKVIVEQEQEPAKQEQTTQSGDGSEKKKEKESIWTGKNSWKVGLVMLTGMTVMGGISLFFSFGAPLLDPEGNEIPDEFSDDYWITAYRRRFYKEVFQQIKMTQEPSRPKLLPDPLQYPYLQPKYTVVMEMNDVLVHPEWSFWTGWRFKKRPGIEQFLRAVGPPLFEVVIYTKDQGFTADPILTQIDPENYIMYRLYRDATRYIHKDRLHVKDLSYLNRDLSKVIMIDWNDQAYKLNPENGFKMKRWEGEDKDVALHDLAGFLRALAASNVDDVRPVLQYYKDFDDPLSQFRDNQRKLKEQQEEQAKLAVSQEQNKLKGYKGFFRR